MWDDIIEKGTPLGARADERTVRVRESWVAKTGPSEDPWSARLPRADSTIGWSGFGKLADGDVVAVRPFFDGQVLADSTGDLETAAKVTAAVRDLHDQGIVHGDLQPRNVIRTESGAIRLIDVALWLDSDHAESRVAGSAPYMAPELWEGLPHTPESDRYALAALLAESLSGRPPLHADDLAGWARAHRDGVKTLRGIEDRVVAGVLERMLSVDPDARPGLQELLDALSQAEAWSPTTRLYAWPLEMVEGARSIVDALLSKTAISLAASAAEGRAAMVDEVIDRLELSGERLVFMRGPSLMRPPLAIERRDGPWGPAIELIAMARALNGLEPRALYLRHGDQLHVFETLTEALAEACARELTIAWDDLRRAGPDVVGWWHHLQGVKAHIPRLRDRLNTFRAGESGESGIEMRIPTIPASRWRRWRAQTLRTEVRDIPEGRFDEILDDHGHGWRAMLDALDREIGARTPVESSGSSWNTARLIRVGDAWRDELVELLDERAFGAAIEMCNNLWRAIRHRSSVDDTMRLGVLDFWTQAVIRGGIHREDADVLEEALTTAEIEGIEILLARLLYKLGRHSEGTDLLADKGGSPELEAWRAQLFLSSGRFDEAESAAARGLERAKDTKPGVVLHLELMALAGPAIRGDAASLEALRDLTPKLESPEISASLRARAHAYRAIGLNRRDELDDATDAYLRALEEIEGAGLDSEMPTYLLNVGTAYHRQGRLGLAREYYARGVRLSQPTTRASTRGLLLVNQANVDIALGRLDESASLLDRARTVGTRDDLRQVLVVAQQLAGDIELERGNAGGALEVWREMLDDEARLRPREMAEVRLSEAEALIALGRERDAGVALEQARRTIEEERITDFEHHLGILRARLQWAEGSSLGTMAGIELFRRSLLGAQSAGNHRLVLRQAPYLVERLEAEGLGELLDEVAERVQSSRNAIAMGLTRELRADFFAQLPEISRRGVEGVSSTERRAQPQRAAMRSAENDERIERFYRMMSLNELILRSASLDELLDTALETALTLSGAERGFVLIKAPEESRIGDFKVAASRDVDGSPIPAPHLEVSLTIAEEAARTGRTVTTINAREDRRFDAALSVVDLDLTSVVCVPIRDGSGLLGALYLDHRFRHGVFEGDLPRMMEAFGHQVALAITNARRLEELERERSKLAEANAQLDDLLAERELEVEGLARRVETLSNQIDRQASGLRERFPEIAFTSSAMERLLDQVGRVARGDVPIVVTGESGVGKELIARALHDASPRADGPFLALNCGAVSRELFESEMFGHVRGAFTGAANDREGLFVAASGGTIFLDEIGEMPLEMQVKLLRVLQERRVRRVGSSESKPVDVRVVAATNRNLEEMVGEGTFREDLYYRLAAITLEVPPLRDRREDIPLIAQAILEQVGGDDGEPPRLTPEAARLLRRSRWPGNVRELENTLRAASVLRLGERIDVETLAPLVRLDGAGARATPKRRGVQETRGRRRKASREDVVEALRRAGDDRDGAAEILGVSQRTLYRYLKRWDLY